jgi:hypothetical protein
VQFNVRVDNFQFTTQVNRMDWLNQIGIVGGIAGFYAGIFAVIVGYFAEFDYLTTVIKKLFLEEQSDKKFFARFLNDHGPVKKSKKNCF